MVEPASRRPFWEVTALVATGGLHLLFENILHAKALFLLFAGTAWLVYLIRRLEREKGLLKTWGFRLDAFKGAMVWATVSGVPLFLLLAVYGHLHHHPLTPSFCILLLLYPLWGLVQQFLLNALLFRNLARLMPAGAAGILSVFLFSLSHAPDLILMGLTFPAGLIWVAIYRRHPNLYALAIWHGILGAAAYVCVLGADPVETLLVLFSLTLR